MGSNQGDRERNLVSGVALLAKEIRDVTTSSVYETDPVGVTDQARFLNLVVRGSTRLRPRDLLHFVKAIEQSVGRRPTFHWGPRVLDIDILMYGYESVDDSDLKVPHPEMLNRPFVLVPLCELAPEVRLPDGSPLCEVVAADPDGTSVRRIGPLAPTL
jgi:2-amino-4-hydroxy-6-hydroxymethyldihydropteridine diphosphokinase